MTLAYPKRTLKLPTRADPSDAWWMLWDVDATQTALADAGTSSAGARTLLGKSGVIVNPSGNFLAAAAGVSVIAGASGGLQFDTTSCVTGPNGDLFNNLGSAVYWSVSNLIDAALATLWPNTTPGPEAIWSELLVAAIIDISEINANSEGVVVGFANNTTFGQGVGAAAVRVASVINATGHQVAATFVSSGSASIATLGMPASPDVLAVKVGHSGGGVLFGNSPGALQYPTQWYSQDKYMAVTPGQAVNTIGGQIRNSAVVYVGVIDAAKTNIKVRIKRLTLWGRNPNRYFPTGAYSQLSAVA